MLRDENDIQPAQALDAAQEPPPKITGMHRAFWFFCFALSAAILNSLPLEISFAVALTFGSVITLLVASLCRPVIAVLVAAVASLPTWYFWGHLWSLGIFVAEALFVALLVRRRPSGVFSSLVLKDSVFWVVLGFPATLLTCRHFIGMPLDASTLVAFKQTLNGVFNAVLAEFCLYLLLPQLRRIPTFSPLPRPPIWPIRDLTLAFMVGTVLVTGLIMATSDSHLISEAEQQRLRHNLSLQTASIEHHLRDLGEDVLTADDELTQDKIRTMLDLLARDELQPELSFIVYSHDQALYSRGVLEAKSNQFAEDGATLVKSSTNSDAVKG